MWKDVRTLHHATVHNSQIMPPNKIHFLNKGTKMGKILPGKPSTDQNRFLGAGGGGGGGRGGKRGGESAADKPPKGKIFCGGGGGGGGGGKVGKLSMFNP